ncbi:uncharacterized protein [Centruroides vittatus]|uniref:uncharacterized protein n=1 Tax=Centruroides vittatus TaxID=120091 RepID=UPI003510BCCB
MTVVLPVLILGVILGRTIDLRTHHTTRFVLNGKNQEHQYTKINHFESRYRVIESSRDVCDLFDVDPRLALIVKLDHFSNDLANRIRSSVVSRDTLVEIQVRAVYKKAIESLSKDFRPEAEWNNKKGLGTHFVSKLRRGGELWATLIFNCDSPDHKDIVSKSVSKILGKSGTFDVFFLDKINELKKDLGKHYREYRVKEVRCPLCTPDSPPSDLRDLIKTTEKLSETVESIEGDVVEMEVEDLATVLKVPPYLENQVIIDRLENLEKMFDDVLIARELFIQWDTVWSMDLTTEDEKQLNDFHLEVERARKEFLHAIGHLDISPSASLSQFDGVYKAYGSTEANDRFQKEFRLLRQKFQKEKMY